MKNSREDVLAIEAATLLFVQGLSRADISSIVDLATETTLVMPASRRTSKGSAVIEFWRRLAMSVDSVNMLSIDMDTLAPGLIRDVGRLGIRSKRGGEQTVFRYMVLWQKTGDAWTIATMAWNRDSAQAGPPSQAGAVGEM